MSTLSVLIQTKNEEKNIRRALESCRFAKAIFVVDNYSTDTTAEIVKEFSNARLLQRKFDGYARQKNWALASLPFETDWIFILDADEVITMELQAELIEKTQGEIPCWYVNRRFIFLNRWIRHAGWYPSWSLRFFKRGYAVYEERSMDEHMIPSGQVGYLKNDLIHEDQNGLEAWIAKHNRYSSLEALEQMRVRSHELQGSLFSRDPILRKRTLKKIFYALPFRPLLRFLGMYIFQLGFLDGYQGFVFCVLRGVQEFHISIKIREQKNRV